MLFRSAGALLTINGQETTVESDGSFGLEVALSGDIKKEINIKSQDPVGNQSSYLGEVWKGNRRNNRDNDKAYGG